MIFALDHNKDCMLFTKQSIDNSNQYYFTNIDNITMYVYAYIYMYILFFTDMAEFRVLNCCRGAMVVSVPQWRSWILKAHRKHTTANTPLMSTH